MTLEDIEDMLPNGLHDARINSINLDYVRSIARFSMEISIAGEEAADPAFRTALLTLEGLLFCVIEAPDSSYPYHGAKALWVDAGAATSVPTTSPARLPVPLPEGAFGHWFFVNDWNAFIYVAATHAHLEWDVTLT